MDNNINVAELLEKLINRKEISTELYNLILEIAEMQAYSNTSSHYNYPEDNVSDFILYLYENHGLGDIRTANALGKEYKKWLVIKNAPEKHELWAMLSQALLSLEKEGICERGEDFRNYNNSNFTEWYLKGKENIKGNTSESNEKLKAIPIFTPVKRKSGSKNQPRIIPPSKAKELALKILEAVDGKITMSDIVYIAYSKVLLTHEVSIDQEPDDTENQPKIQIPTPSDDKGLSLEIILKNDIDHISSEIWKEVSRLSRKTQNGTIDGCRILCCYLLPKMSNSPVTLEEFGPSTTVSELAADIKNI